MYIIPKNLKKVLTNAGLTKIGIDVSFARVLIDVRFANSSNRWQLCKKVSVDDNFSSILKSFTRMLSINNWTAQSFIVSKNQKNQGVWE